MTRYTTFKLCLDPTEAQRETLARHAGASRFGFNQCLRLVKTGLDQRRQTPDVDVPWTRFDLINAFNAWKKSEAAGRIFAVDSAGATELVVTGLSWRHEVYQQVFEEAAVDCGRALAAWSNSTSDKSNGRRVGFPRFKKKVGHIGSFRLRNRYVAGGQTTIRIGDNDRPRSVTLPGIGIVAIHNDTRRLRRMLAKRRAKVVFATVSLYCGRWWISLTVEAADLHNAARHPVRYPGDHGGWVGVDRGLAAFVVAATTDGSEVSRIDNAPKALAAGMRQQRRLAKRLSRKQIGSRNRRDAVIRLARHHAHVRNVRRHFLHQVSNELVKTHDRLVIEDLNVAGMLANQRLARAISDAGWAEFARQLQYKADWRGGIVATANRWYPSSKRCSNCGQVRTDLTLTERVFSCDCGYRADRDLNAAVNLGQWGESQQPHPEPRTRKCAGRVINARRRDGSGRRTSVPGETDPEEAGTDVQPPPAG